MGLMQVAVSCYRYHRNIRIRDADIGDIGDSTVLIA